MSWPLSALTYLDDIFSSRRSPTRSAVSFSRSVRPNSCQTRNSVQQMHYSTPSQLNNDTIANFEQVLDSARWVFSSLVKSNLMYSRSLREAPLTEHQLSLTQQLKDIGAAGYGNKYFILISWLEFDFYFQTSAFAWLNQIDSFW